MSRPLKIMISAGEASGDRLGAGLARSLLRMHPGIELYGMGGDEMEDAGVRLVQHASEVAVVGFVEVIRHLPTIRRAMSRLETAARDRAPRHSGPDRFSRLQSATGREGRSRRDSGRLLRQPAGVGVAQGPRRRDEEAGAAHARALSLRGRLLRSGRAWPPRSSGIRRRPGGSERSRARAPSADRSRSPSSGRGAAPGKPRRRGRPDLSGAARCGARALANPPRRAVLVPQARTIPDGFLEGIAAEAPAREPRRLAAMLIPASSTSPMPGRWPRGPRRSTPRSPASPSWRSTACSRCPISWPRRLVRVDHVALPNLIAGARIVPELVQGSFTPEAVAGVLASFLTDRSRAATLRTRAPRREGAALRRWGLRPRGGAVLDEARQVCSNRARA